MLPPSPVEEEPSAASCYASRAATSDTLASQWRIPPCSNIVASPLLSREAFLRRQLRFAALSAAIVLGALAIGTFGYHTIEGLPWLDAQLNAAMILTGMGPVDRMQTAPGKLFASAYALVSGVLFVTTVAVLFAPVIHRFFHHLHLDSTTSEPA